LRRRVNRLLNAGAPSALSNHFTRHYHSRKTLPKAKMLH
jgi:hypothetical protein